MDWFVVVLFAPSYKRNKLTGVERVRTDCEMTGLNPYLAPKDLQGEFLPDRILEVRFLLLFLSSNLLH